MKAVLITQVSSSMDYWDETAPDMLSFAASGPGWAALAVALVLGAVVLNSYFEFIPAQNLLRNGSRLSASTDKAQYYLNVRVGAHLKVELPSGVVADLVKDDLTVIREEEHIAIDAVARAIAGAAEKLNVRCEFTVYRVKGQGFSLVRAYPKETDAVGAPGWIEVEQRNPSPEREARWDEYSRLQSIGPVERQWRSFVDSLGGVAREDERIDSDKLCKLCGGSGHRRCSRCMGAARSSAFECDACSEGRVRCDWCDGTGQAQ